MILVEGLQVGFLVLIPAARIVALPIFAPSDLNANSAVAASSTSVTGPSLRRLTAALMDLSATLHTLSMSSTSSELFIMRILFKSPSIVVKLLLARRGSRRLAYFTGNIASPTRPARIFLPSLALCLAKKSSNVSTERISLIQEIPSAVLALIPPRNSVIWPSLGIKTPWGDSSITFTGK